MKYSIPELILLDFHPDALDCAEDARFPWFPTGGLTVMEPWSSYPLPEANCCLSPEPSAVFDVQGRAAALFLSARFFLYHPVYELVVLLSLNVTTESAANEQSMNTQNKRVTQE